VYVVVLPPASVQNVFMAAETADVSESKGAGVIVLDIRGRTGKDVFHGRCVGHW